MVVIIYCCIVIFVQQALVDELTDGLSGDERVDGAGTVAQQVAK